MAEGMHVEFDVTTPSTEAERQREPEEDADMEDVESDAPNEDEEEDDSFPVELGFYMPAEWEPHKQCWMGWPTRGDNWRNRAEPAQRAYAAVAAAINEFEPVTICVPHQRWFNSAKKLLPPQVEVLVMPQDDAWFRDTGPTFIVKDTEGGPGNRLVAGVHWKFNAWGGLYRHYANDAKVAANILGIEGVRRFRSMITLEGGSIHVDGEGTLLTTEECLLNPNRNPQRSKTGIQYHISQMLNIQKFIWLPYGLHGDTDTSGHVDNMACFARPGLVLLNWTDDVSNPQYERSLAAYNVLVNSTDAKGRKIEVVKVPIPLPMHYGEEEVAGLRSFKGSMELRQAGEALAASYINFYLANGGVVMPAFGGVAAETDAQAKAIMERVFPDRKVVAVPTREILLGGGNIHCITQQQPYRHAGIAPEDKSPEGPAALEPQAKL